MLCGLSGKDAVEPVVSPVSGKVYERSLIETWIAERGTDPATNTPLSRQQLVRLDLVPANPEITSTTSIPALLQALQTEFNALAVENFELKQQNAKQRAELSESSYKIEAALRVITRVTQERDELRQALEQLDALAPNALIDNGADGEEDRNHQNRQEDPLGQGNAPPDNNSMDVSVPVEQPEPEDMLVETEAEQQEDLLAQNEPNVPSPPNSTDPHNILETRKLLTAQRKQFNSQTALVDFRSIAPRYLPNASGNKLQVCSNWAIVTTSGQDTLIDLRTCAPLNIEWDHTVRHMSFLETDAPRVALLSVRRLAIWDPETQVLLKDAPVQGNPLEALWHPAQFIIVRFSSKIEVYDGETLALNKSMSLTVPKCLAFALHPDGEFLIYHSGASPRAKSLVFHSLIKNDEVLTVDTDGPVSSITPSKNGYHVAYFDGNSLAILDLRSDDPPIKPQLPADYTPRQLSFDSTGRRLYVSSARTTLVYIPQQDEWSEQVIGDEDSIISWSGEKMQIPIAIKSDS